MLKINFEVSIKEMYPRIPWSSLSTRWEPLLWSSLGVSFKSHASAAVPQGTEVRVPTAKVIGRAPKPVWTLKETNFSLLQDVPQFFV